MRLPKIGTAVMCLCSETRAAICSRYFVGQATACVCWLSGLNWAVPSGRWQTATCFAVAGAGLDAV